jgi:hypothetical protein
VYAFAGLDNKTNTIRSLDEYHDLEDNYGKGELCNAVTRKYEANLQRKKHIK